MSTFRPPSERRATFNPVFYTSDSETGATLADLDQKLNRINGTSSGQTLTNASFSGTVTGLNTGMIPTLDSQLSALSAGNANSNFKANYSKSYLNSWDPATIGYLDFSDPAQLGQDATGKGNDAVIVGPVSYVANATRTNAVRFPVECVGSAYPSENTPCIQLDNQLQMLKTLSPSNWSISLWVNLDPASTGVRPTILAATRRDDTGLPPTSIQLWTDSNGNIQWRGRLDGSSPNGYGMGKLPVGTWAHLAMVFTPSNVTTYINGVQTAVCSTAGLVIDSLATKGINTLTLGSTHLSTNVTTTFLGHLAFAGMMSDISVHARALTQPEIARLTADDYGASIFVLAGSSNMVGVPQVVAGIDNVYPTRVIQYDTASNQAGGTAVLQASNPLRNMGTIVTGSTGLWRTFVSDMHQYGKLAWRRKILVVPCGYTGSSFASEWAADGLMSNVTISAVNGAMNRNTMNSVAAFLWSSGETDVANIRLTYAADLQAMFSLFQASIPGFSTTTTPIILAEVSQLALGDYVVGAVGTKRMIQQIREDVASLTAGNANMKVVKTSDLLCMQLSSTNWNIDSIRTLGSRYFDAFSQIKGFSRNQPVTILGPASAISASTGLPVALLTNETLSGQTLSNASFSGTADFTGATVSGLSLLDVQTVKYYGAVGDGIADDTAAIQAAINANAKRVFFPQGTYRITGELLIQNKPEFELSSESATLLQDHTTSTLFCLRIINCDGFHMDGRLILKSNIVLATPVFTTEVVSGYGNGLYIGQSNECTLNNLQVLGPFLTGISLGLSDMLMLNTLSELVVKRCVVGIAIPSEYYTVENSIVEFCRIGIFITGGNNSVVSSSLNLNRIGIYVLGGTTVNTDHGKIIGCTVNHNCAAGILIKNTQYSFHITGCEVWANVGNTAFYQGYLPVSLDTDITSTSARSTFFGVYLENVESINMTGNVISRNCVNVGLDGWVVSTISTNTFGTDNSRTTSHITEYGSGHDAYARNAQNVVTSNTFYGAYKAGSPNIRMKFLDAPATTNDDCCVAFSDNRGTTGIHYLQVNSGTTGAQLYDMNYEYMNLHAASPANVKLHPSTGGSAITINVSGIGGAVTSKTVGVQTTTPEFVPMSMTPSCTYNDTTKQYTFTANGSYRFFPTGIFMNNWTIYGPDDGSTISDLQAADTALQGRALLLEDGVSLLGARVGSLEATGSGAPTFQKLTQGSTTVETNASLKNVYFLTMSANSNTTLTFPDLVPGDSKYSGFSIKVRVRSGSATETLTLTCPASPSAFVPMAAGRYNSKVFNALDSYVEYVTAEGDYVELVSTAVN